MKKIRKMIAAWLERKAHFEQCRGNVQRAIAHRFARLWDYEAYKSHLAAVCIHERNAAFFRRVARFVACKAS